MTPVPALRRALVVMGKLPRAGSVKTRLSPALSLGTARSLYEAFLLDVFALVDHAHAASGGAFERIFACAVSGDCSTVSRDDRCSAEALPPNGWRTVLQHGPTLGERIESARREAGASDVVIIGSDSPTLPHERLLEAFDVLGRARAERSSGAAPRTAVIGPTTDGGYYLIGLSGPEPALLGGIPWSTNEVMSATRAAAMHTGVHLVELPVGYDIDEVGDLERALEDASAPASTARRTKEAIREALASLERAD